MYCDKIYLIIKSFRAKLTPAVGDICMKRFCNQIIEKNTLGVFPKRKPNFHVCALEFGGHTKTPIGGSIMTSTLNQIYRD